MPRRISLTNFFNQIKSSRADHGYHLINSSQNTESLCESSSSETIPYGSKQSQDRNEFNDIFKNRQQIHYCSTERILSRDARNNFEIVYERHPGFTMEQVSSIKNALQIIVDRFFKAEILQNMYQICSTSGCFLADGVWSHSNLRAHTVYKDEHLLLKYQLMCLRSKSESGELPTMNIYPSHRNSEEENSNYLGCVSCIRHEPTFLIDGEFEIELNEEQFNQSKETSSNALLCAGEIVYELLRNLDHQCDGSYNARQSQINVFKKCFLYDGCYFPNKM